MALCSWKELKPKLPSHESKVFWGSLTTFLFLEVVGPPDLTSCLRFFLLRGFMVCFWSVAFLLMIFSTFLASLLRANIVRMSLLASSLH